MRTREERRDDLIDRDRSSRCCARCWLKLDLAERGVARLKRVSMGDEGLRDSERRRPAQTHHTDSAAARRGRYGDDGVLRGKRHGGWGLWARGSKLAATASLK